MILKKIRSIALATVAVIIPVFGSPALAMTPELEAYANSSYGYCDAKKIAASWKVGIVEAKTALGAKVLNNIEHLADQDIASTKNSVACDWADTQLSFNDAEKLAAYWGRDTSEAKQKAVQMFSELGTKGFFNAMGDVVTQN